MANEEDSPLKHRSEHHFLVNSLKTVVEGLLATHSKDVWSTYGGLNRVTKAVEKIFFHGLRSTQGKFGSQLEFWPFVQALKRLNPILSPSIDKISRLAHGNPGIDKGHVWVEESLREHNLTTQLQTLVSDKEHLKQYYKDYAFLCMTEYFEAMCMCLQAVEQNKVTLLTELDVSLMSGKQHCEVKRSESLPVMRRGSSQHDALALAPHFASPKQESLFCLSDEHAVPITIGSNSPIETKMMARDALRSVLRKSGSESPTDASDTGFSFYDNTAEDPLSHVTIAEQQTTGEVKVKDEDVNKSKTVIAKKAMTPDPVPSSDNTYSRPDEIFSDSETLQDGKSGARSKQKSSGKGHKRSRSDMTWSTSTVIPKRIQRIYSEDVTGTNEEDSGTEVNDPSPEGYMGRPTQGQSLLQYLATQDFHTCANLDKENAHFSISEALIAAIEQMKWNHVISPQENEEEDSDEEIQQLKQRIRIRKRERLKEKARGFPALSDGVTDTATSQSTSPPLGPPYENNSYEDSSNSSEVDEEQIELTMSENINEGNLLSMRKDGMSLSLASLYSDGDNEERNSQMNLERQSSITTVEGSVNVSNSLSAESVAISLLKKFSEKQLPKASDLVWLVSEKDVPQKLLPMPDSYPVSPDDAEDQKITRLQTRLRGNHEWAPPRPQIIFNIHPRSNRKSAMEKQNYLCAGCGTRIDPGYISRLRYCEYLGKYFCQCCHGNNLSYIPARILKKWDFTKYQVSNFSHDFLRKIYTEPLFNISDINVALYKRVKYLDTILELRLKLQYVKKFLEVCKDAVKLLNEVTKLPPYWSDDVHIYSVCDLVNVKNQQLLTQLKQIVSTSVSHVETCQFCQGLGFICEFCHNDKDVIFPFQLHKVDVCPSCKSCYHKECFIPEKCPRCARLEARRLRLEQKFSEEEEMLDDG